MVQAFRTLNRAKHVKFCNVTLRDTENDNFLQRLIFSAEATIYVSGKINHYIIPI